MRPRTRTAAFFIPTWFTALAGLIVCIVLSRQSLSFSEQYFRATHSIGPGENVALKTSPRSVCLDTCRTANNGKCEDGRGLFGSKVVCDLGTDCTDCGEWRGSTPSSNRGKNIESLTGRGVEVFVQRTITKPSFLMPYTRPDFDVDVSGQMARARGVELGETHLWYHALKSCCRRPDGTRGLVLDVGGNFGWYALFSARMGCRVKTWEPIPHFRDFLEYGVDINNMTDVVEVRGKAVGNETGIEYEMVVPQRGIWGTASIDGRNIDRTIDNAGEYEKVKAFGERIDDVVSEDVCVFKADVEGFEPGVFDSAKNLFENHRVEHVFIEYSPGVWERAQNFAELRRITQMLLNLLRQGYNIRNIPDWYSKGVVRGEDFDKPPPSFEMVTEENLKYDKQDIEDCEKGRLGCSNLTQALLDDLNALGMCHRIPENLHPKSFHSAFGFNTNVWVSRKDADKVPLGPAVGVIKPSEDDAKYFKTAEYGQGGRTCESIPPDSLTIHRCPCKNRTSCGEIESKILDAVKRARQNDAT